MHSKNTHKTLLDPTTIMSSQEKKEEKYNHHPIKRNLASEGSAMWHAISERAEKSLSEMVKIVNAKC